MFSLYLKGCLSKTLQSSFQCTLLISEVFVVDLMNPVNDMIVQQLLFLVVQGGIQLFVPQPSVFPDLLQRVVLHQATVLKNSHQQVLQDTEHTQINHEVQQEEV